LDVVLGAKMLFLDKKARKVRKNLVVSKKVRTFAPAYKK